MGSYETLESVWDRTLAYSNIFDFPLKKDEIRTYAISSQPIQESVFDKWFNRHESTLRNEYKEKDGYWMLKNRNLLAETREDRNYYSKRKLKIAKRATFFLFLLPWVKTISVSGAVAAGNATKHDDIDLFVITEPNRIWLTRALFLTAASITRRRNKVYEEKKGNRFCLNHIIKSSDLAIETQDAYTANDIARLKVLWDRGHTFKKFLLNNTWIKKHLATWWESQDTTISEKKDKKQNVALFALTAPLRTPLVLIQWLLDGLESFSRRTQRSILTRNQPRDLNDSERLTYHIRDNRNWVLREYYLLTK